MALVRIPRLPALMRLPRWGSARSWAVALALLACVLPHASHADVVISNVPIATNGGTTLSSTDSKALIFTTGTAASTVNQVILGLNPMVQANVPSLAKVDISLYSTVAGVPSTQLASTGLLNVDIQQLQGSYTFPITGGFSLSANTQYALVIRSDATGIKWGNTSTSEPTGSGGFTYQTFVGSSDSGATWTAPITSMKNVLQLRVTVAPPVLVPALSVWGVALFGLLVAGAGVRLQRRRSAGP